MTNSKPQENILYPRGTPMADDTPDDRIQHFLAQFEVNHTSELPESQLLFFIGQTQDENQRLLETLSRMYELPPPRDTRMSLEHIESYPNHYQLAGLLITRLREFYRDMAAELQRAKDEATEAEEMDFIEREGARNNRHLHRDDGFEWP